MGEVYVAEDTRLRRRVALKVLPRDVAGDAERRDRFARAAQAIGALDHPNIVAIHSIEHDGDVHHLTVELVEGRSLSELIARGGLPLDRLLPLAVQLAGRGRRARRAHESTQPHRQGVHQDSA